MTHIALKLEAQRLRREELGRIARLIALKIVEPSGDAMHRKCKRPTLSAAGRLA